MRIMAEVFGDTILDRTLLRWQERAADLSPAFEVLADDFLAIETHQFASEGGNSGHWAPLAPATIAARSARSEFAHLFGYHQPDPGGIRILDETGRLKDSLTKPDHADAVRDIGPREMFVGTAVEYAQYHQAGTSRMPQRKPVELTRADKDRWIRSLQRFFATGEAGL
jgi:hypothetical protein